MGWILAPKSRHRIRTNERTCLTVSAITSHQYFMSVRLRRRFFRALVSIGSLQRLHVPRKKRRLRICARARAVLHFRMTTRKTDALARETISFFLHRPEFANGCFQTGFWHGNRVSEFNLMNLTAVKNRAPSNFCAQNRLTEKNHQPTETRDRQTLSKSPCQLSRVLSPLSGNFTIPRDPRKLIRSGRTKMRTSAGIACIEHYKLSCS